MDTNILGSEKRKKIFYMVMTAIIIVLTYVMFTVQADSNDDPGMMQYISGFYCGKPGILPYIMGTPYTFLISMLYRITTQIPWYGLIFMIINIGAIWVIFLKYMKDSYNINRYLIFIGLYIVLFLWQLTNIQFTMVAGLAGGAAIMLVNDSCENDKKNIKVLEIILTLVFFFFSYNIRYQCGYVTLAVIAYITIGKGVLYKKWNKKQIISFISCIIILGLSYICNNEYINNTEWKAYETLNAQRSYYMDTEHLSYNENFEIYKSIGWDENIYCLINSWCFMVEEANYESFKTINEFSLQTKMDLNLDILNSVTDFISLLKTETIVLFFWLCGIILFGIHKIKQSNEYKFKEMIYISGFIIMAVIFVMYLIFFGRYNSRVIIMMFDCCLIPGVYAIITDFERHDFMYKKVAEKIVIASLLVMSVLSLNKQFNRSIITYDKWDSVYEYVISNKDNVYVGDGSMISPCDLFESFSEETAPTNYFWWGGWLAESPFAKSQKEKNNLKQLYLDDMLDENKYFIGNKEYMNLLHNYYNNRYYNVNSKIFCEIDDYIVYGFRK